MLQYPADCKPINPLLRMGKGKIVNDQVERFVAHPRHLRIVHQIRHLGHDRDPTVAIAIGAFPLVGQMASHAIRFERRGSLLEYLLACQRSISRGYAAFLLRRLSRRDGRFFSAGAA